MVIWRTSSYELDKLNAGTVLRNRLTDAEIFFQPGDDEETIHEEAQAITDRHDCVATCDELFNQLAARVFSAHGAVSANP